jgi:hypothetical protein
MRYLEGLCERLDNDARSDEVIECDAWGRTTRARHRSLGGFDTQESTAGSPIDGISY